MSIECNVITNPINQNRIGLHIIDKCNTLLKLCIYTHTLTLFTKMKKKTKRINFDKFPMFFSHVALRIIY